MTVELAPSHGTPLTAAFFLAGQLIRRSITTTSESQQVRASCVPIKATDKRYADSSGAPTDSSWQVAAMTIFSAFGTSTPEWGEESSATTRWARLFLNLGTASPTIRLPSRRLRGALGRGTCSHLAEDRETRQSSSGTPTPANWFHLYKLSHKCVLFNGIPMTKRFSPLTASSTINCAFGNILRWRKSPT